MADPKTPDPAEQGRFCEDCGHRLAPGVGLRIYSRSRSQLCNECLRREHVAALEGSPTFQALASPAVREAMQQAKNVLGTPEIQRALSDAARNRARAAGWADSGDTVPRAPAVPRAPERQSPPPIPPTQRRGCRRNCTLCKELSDAFHSSDPNLSLAAVSKAISVSPGHLSKLRYAHRLPTWPRLIQQWRDRGCAIFTAQMCAVSCALCADRQTPHARRSSQ
jgi:hypothetical protein